MLIYLFVMTLVMKNKLNLTLLILILIIPELSFSQKPAPRIMENFDFDWKFILDGSVDASAREYDDSKWENIQLPHDWSITLPPAETVPGRKYLAGMGFRQVGTGWYRKDFFIPSSYKNKKVYIRFDGVYHQADVYINGNHLGFHPYGYTEFEYDLSPWLNFNADNNLAVKVDHSNYPSSRWYSGSGIYRHVWLIVTEKIHVTSRGTYITTPHISEGNAEINIVTSVVNNSGKSENIVVQSRILNPEGLQTASLRTSATVSNGGSESIGQSVSLKDPWLWSADDPFLYNLETIVTVRGRVTDTYTTTFGIRYFHFDSDSGFFLNGKNIKLKGVNLHQDAGSMGTAVPDMSLLRRLKILKEYGCNAIRCSHNPPSPEFPDMCDSIGFLVIDEAFDKWRSGYYAKYFDEWWKRDLSSMLMRDRNHPSIIMWSIGNETSEQNDTSGAGTAVAKMMQNYVHEIEPARPVTVAISPSDVSVRPYNENGFTEVFDIVGYNYQEPWLLRDRKRFPDRKMYIAEAFPYYTGRSNNIRDYKPDNPWYAVQNNDFVFGQFIWAGVDYLGESSGWPSTGWPTGLFDVCMFEKPRAAFHRSVWNDSPLVRIAVADQSLDIDPGKDHWSWPHLADHWNFPQYRGHIIEVHTVSNCDSVELWVNKMTMGRRAVSDYSNNTIVWHVPYREGKIEAKGFKGGKEMAQYELNTSGNPANIMLIPETRELKADGQDLIHIIIKVVDDKGVTVPDKDILLSVEVEGAGRLKGLDNGDLRVRDSFSGNAVRSYFGKALATIQSGRSPGEIMIRVTASGMPAKTFTITSK